MPATQQIPSTFLTRDELASLTGRTRASAQIRALRAMGIQHRVRPDGKAVVLWSDVQTDGSRRQQRPTEPDFAALLRR